MSRRRTPSGLKLISAMRKIERGLHSEALEEIKAMLQMEEFWYEVEDEVSKVYETRWDCSNVRA